jgi:hypothetical protein
MGRAITLDGCRALGDLHVFLERAARIEDGSVRLIAGSGILAVYVAVLYPAGLHDETPTVLGLRTFALRNTDVFDSVVPLRSLLTRIERAESEATDADAPVEVTLPLEVYTATWAAISPPRGGWTPLPATTAEVLDAAGRAGIDEVAAAVPSAAGEQVVRVIRSEVWSRSIRGLEHIPAATGFAALSLGFIGDDGAETVSVYETGPWTRLTLARGHVLVKRRAWNLAR